MAPRSDPPEAVAQAFHILDSFDIPLGVVRPADEDTTPYELTQWTAASDTQSRSYYFHSYGNRRVRRVDLMQADLDATKVIKLPLDDEADVRVLKATATEN